MSHPPAESIARRAASLVPALLAALLLLFVVVRLGELVAVAFIATLIAVYLTALTDQLQRVAPGLPRPLALVVALLGSLAALAGIGALVAPALVSQTQDLIVSVPSYLEKLDRAVIGLVARYPVLGSASALSGDTGFVSSLLRDIGDFLRRETFRYATISGKIAIDTVAVLVMAFYTAMRPTLYSDGLVSLTPPRHRETMRVILADLRTALRAWIGAQIIAMVVLGLLTAIGLWVLDVPYWLSFGIFAGIAVMVPFFGTILSTLIPALLIAGERGWLAFLAVASVGVVVHLVEANVVHPLIMQHRLALPPVLTIFSVLVMAKIGGLLGMVVAVPTLATIFVVARHVLLQGIYGDGAMVPVPPVVVMSRRSGDRPPVTPPG